MTRLAWRTKKIFELDKLNLRRENFAVLNWSWESHLKKISLHFNRKTFKSSFLPSSQSIFLLHDLKVFLRQKKKNLFLLFWINFDNCLFCQDNLQKKKVLHKINIKDSHQHLISTVFEELSHSSLRWIEFSIHLEVISIFHKSRHPSSGFCSFHNFLFGKAANVTAFLSSTLTVILSLNGFFYRQLNKD